MSKLTKQGVRDLGNTRIKKNLILEPCHHEFEFCCRDKKCCSHINCKKCGLGFDLGSELNGKWIW